MPRRPSLLLFCALACGHAAAAPSRLSEQAAGIPASALGPGDVFEVRVFQEPDLSGIYRVASDGTIDFPLCGKLQVAGQQGSAVTEALTRCLSSGYLKRPQVSIYVKEFNSKKIFVFGEVQKPGTFQYEDSMSVVQAVTLAGGFAQRADRNNVSVARLVDGREMRIKVQVADIGLGRAANFALVPGDIVFVPESLF